ncbi:MAG: hypothetical protein KF795_32345, partial [Labilithrix sp.]|nr:hypothetical protein [Labilithrix sp.]
AVKRAVAAALVTLVTLVTLVGCSRSQTDPYADEVREREAFAKKLLVEADAGRALGVSSTSEIQFEEGFGILSYETDPKDGHPSFSNHAFRWMGQNAHVRLKTHGGRPMKLQVVGWAHLKVIGTQPVINIYIDGLYVGSTPPIGGEGHYWIEQVIPEWALRRPWVDLVLRTTAVGYHWGDPPELKVLNVYRFGWTEAN